MNPSATNQYPLSIGDDVLVTVERTHDWIAFFRSNENKWEVGQTEMIAVGKLVLRTVAEQARDDQRFDIDTQRPTSYWDIMK